MNAGYSSGWCEESFGITLVASEIMCVAKGDPTCRFIMAPPSRIEEHIARYTKQKPELAGRITHYEAPGFFKRKEIEAQLRQSEDRFRSILESSPMGVHLYQLQANAKLELIGANQAADRIFRVDHKALIGKPVEETLPNLGDPTLAARFAKAAASGEVSQSEAAITENGKTTGAVEVHAFPTSPGQMAALFLDVSGRKRAEDARSGLEEQFRHAQKMEAVGRLAGGIAHDLNNLLTTILYSAKFVIEGLRHTDPARADVVEIEKAANRAASLTRQLLAFSRKSIIQPRKLDLNWLVRDMEKMLGRIVGEDIEIQIRLSEVGAITADASYIEQVLANLVVNARDAMPDGGKLTIETSRVVLDEDYAHRHLSFAPGSYVMLAVSDNGVGMAADVREHIFEPFFTTKKEGQGTGLGLATVYGIVKQMDGHIWVYSEPGQGTTFKIYFPVPVPGSEYPEAAVRIPAPQQATGTVLLVEDEDAVRRIIRRVLERHGYKVLAAKDAGQALLVLESHTGGFDVLLSDVVLPGMSGRALAERLKIDRPDLPVVYMSATPTTSSSTTGSSRRGSCSCRSPSIWRICWPRSRKRCMARARAAASLPGSSRWPHPLPEADDGGRAMRERLVLAASNCGYGAATSALSHE
jgi:two-component system cell cycle sensor histidine kinase/response regulator CckA